MRVSTAMLHQGAVSQLQRQQSALARTQLQMATGQRLQSAADDPSGAANAIGLDHAQAQFQRYQDSIDAARYRLGIEENVLEQGTAVLQRVRELAIQLNSGSQSAQTRGVIATELRGLREQLIGHANADDGQGRYLFGGSQNSAPPFAGDGTITYVGDQQQRLLQVSNSRTVADADAGSEVFLRLREGNGTFSIAADTANTGVARLGSARLTDAALWDGGSYTLSFTGGNYEVRDAGNAVVAGGAYTAGQTISFRGIDLTLTGQPADGDSFAIGPAAQRDVFAQIEDLARIAEAPADTAAQRAQQQTAIHQSLSGLEQATLHLVDMRAAVGNRLAVLDDAEAQNGAQQVEVQSTLSQIRDLDYAEAATRLTQQLTALQAAQQTYAQVQGLSLFDFLR